MVEIQLHSERLCTDTLVSNKFIDDYMPLANGEFVKIYLYLLRCMHSQTARCTITSIADRFNHTETDVIRALTYWEKQGLLSLEYNAGRKITGIRLLALPNAPTDAASGESSSSDSNGVPAQAALSPSGLACASAEASVPASPVPATVPVKRDYTLDEISAFRKDPDISELFFVVETYMKRPLTQNDVSTVLYWHEELHFSTELIVYLLEYCISKGHSSMRYLDKVALSWHEKGIHTVEQAKEDAAIHSQAYYGVMKAFGITGRSLVESETSYIKKWTQEYGFDLPLIREACSRTMTAIHQPSFEYTDSILTSWHKNQVHTLADVQKLDAAYSQTRKVTVKTEDAPVKKNAFNNFNQRSYDYDKLEELLLTTSLHG